MHRVWVKQLRGDEEDDQVVAGIFNIIQKRANTGVHLKIEFVGDFLVSQS